MKTVCVAAMLVGLCWLGAGCSSARGESSVEESNGGCGAGQEGPPPKYFVLIHSSGPKWNPDLSAFDQEGIGDHVAHFEAQLEAGRLVLGGPFIDGSGGMMILDVKTRKEADDIAGADPAVKSELLLVQVRPWIAALARK